MSVSLVKISPATIVYMAGHNTAGYSPDSEPAVFATLESARLYLADEIDRLADFLYDTELVGVDDSELADSVAADVEIVKNDRDGDIAHAVTTFGSWHTAEDDGRSLPTVYWIQTAPLGEAVEGLDAFAKADLIDELSSL